MKACMGLVVVLVAAAFARCTTAAADTAVEFDVSADVPNILQIEPLPGGGLLVLTSDKGGLYLGGPGGRDWRKAKAGPDVFAHRAAVAADGRIYLATSDGLFRITPADGRWEQLLQGALGRIELSRDGSRALVKVWGKGVFVLPTEQLSADLLQRSKEAAAQKQALERQEQDLVRRMASRPEGEHSGPQGLRKMLGTYGEWRRVNERIQTLDEVLRRSGLSMQGGLAGQAVLSAAVAADGTWLAASFGHGIYSSRSEGREWEAFSDGLSCPWVLAVAATPWQTVYAGTYGAGLFAWNPGDSGWAPVEDFPSEASVQDVAFDPEGRFLLAACADGLRMSQDRGRTWRRLDPVAGGAVVQSVAVDREGSLWAGTWNRGLYVSTDQGASWHHRPFADVFYVADIAFAKDGDGYAVLAGRGLYRSLDQGRQWRRLKMPVRPAKGLRLAVETSGRLFLGSPDDGLWMSEDRGESWTRDSQGLPAKGVYGVKLSPGGILLAIPSDASGLYARSESGQWQRLPLQGEDDWDYSVWEMMFLPDGRCVAAGLQDLLLSDDGGGTWRRHRFGQPSLAFAVDAAGTIYSQRAMSTFALHRDAAEWEETSGVPADAYVIFSPAGHGRWVAARHGGGVAVLDLRGADAAAWGPGLDGERVVSLAVAADGSVFAGLSDRLAVSRDRGRTWQTLPAAEE